MDKKLHMEKYPLLEKPILNKRDISMLTDYCNLHGYILDIYDENAIIRNKDGKKVFIQKDYWKNVWICKNRFTPKQEWENITENMKVLAVIQKKVRPLFFDAHIMPMFSILSFNSMFNGQMSHV